MREVLATEPPGPHIVPSDCPPVNELAPAGGQEGRRESLPLKTWVLCDVRSITALPRVGQTSDAPSNPFFANIHRLSKDVSYIVSVSFLFLCFWRGKLVVWWARHRLTYRTSEFEEEIIFI